MYKKPTNKKFHPIKSRKSGAFSSEKQFNGVKCQNCAHYCNISPGKRGICGVRENIGGKLYTLNYGKIIACHIDPIEKKPLFHFLPGSYSLSIAAVGCNFSCLNCQNYDISQGFKENPPAGREIPGENLPPKKIVELAKKNKLPSISYTYTEPAIFSEYALETMKIARKQGIKNNWVTNGFWSKELFDLISHSASSGQAPLLDAANIDLKSFSDEFYIKNCGARLQPVLDAMKLVKKAGIWLEITTLAIPTLSDSEKTFKDIARFIKEELGPETPWHISRFSGTISWKLQHFPETPVETLKTAYQIGKEAGLKYVYTGNIVGLPFEDTFCPKCNNLCIDRTNHTIHRYDKKGKCPKCSTDLNLILK